MLQNHIKINISILTNQTHQVVYCWFIIHFPSVPLNLCIIQLSIATSAKKSKCQECHLGMSTSSTSTDTGNFRRIGS